MEFQSLRAPHPARVRKSLLRRRALPATIRLATRCRLPASSRVLPRDTKGPVASSRPKKLSTLRLAAATYFLVAGGPYGLEELVQAKGYAWAGILLVLTPLAFSLPTALMVGELGSALPAPGGYYAWVTRALGPFAGFVEAWLSLSASVFDMAIYPTIFVSYLARAFPNAGVEPLRTTIGASMIAVCTIHNLRGARSIGGASVLFGVILLGPFVLLSLLAALSPSHAPALDLKSTGALGSGLLVAMWNFMGWDNASTFANEVDAPQRTYPRAMALGVAAVAITYLVPVLAAWRSGVPASSWSTGAWVSVAEQIGGVWLGRAVVLGGLLCGLGMYNALLLSYSRLPAALAKDGLLPSAFARTNAHGVPVLSVLACSALYALALVFDFRKLIELDLLFYGAALLLEFVALFVLRVREPGLVRPFRVPGGKPVAALLGACPLALFAAGLHKEFSDGTSHQDSVLIALGSIALGALVWRSRRASDARA